MYLLASCFGTCINSYLEILYLYLTIWITVVSSWVRDMPMHKIPYERYKGDCELKSCESRQMFTCQNNFLKRQESRMETIWKRRPVGEGEEGNKRSQWGVSMIRVRCKCV
jgi:hypothetical protein